MFSAFLICEFLELFVFYRIGGVLFYDMLFQQLWANRLTGARQDPLPGKGPGEYST